MKYTIQKTPHLIRVEFDHCEVGELSLEDVVKFCLTLPEVEALNASDYCQQYYTINMYANSMEVEFRKEVD